tara:strand:+ start:39 stop:491 length:453 start_codon:yes stop_codon:yes gene_type:complete
MKNYYQILQCDKLASLDKIKKAYRKLALKSHPDRGGDAEQFKAISEAYEILSDPDKRRQYDLGTNVMVNINPDDLFNHFFQGFDLNQTQSLFDPPPFNRHFTNFNSQIFTNTSSRSRSIQKETTIINGKKTVKITTRHPDGKVSVKILNG